MNLNDPQHPWQRTVRVARNASDDRDTAAPYGFATRVVARAFDGSLRPASLVEHYALRAFGVACLLALLSVAVNYSALTSTTAPVATAAASATEEEELSENPVELLLSVN
jgi:hypothetical protein